MVIDGCRPFIENLAQISQKALFAALKAARV